MAAAAGGGGLDRRSRGRRNLAAPPLLGWRGSRIGQPPGGIQVHRQLQH